MYYRYSTAFSQLFPLAIGFCCFKSYYSASDEFKLPLVSYGILIVHSLIGIWKWGNPAHGWTTEKIYAFTRILQTLLTFPCIVGQLWLNHEDKKEFAYLHPFAALLPLFLYMNRHKKLEFVDLIIGFNILSCICISLYVSNWFGVTTALAYTINHFVIKDESEVFDMPSIDFYNYALCFFTFFSLRALQGVY